MQAFYSLPVLLSGVILLSYDVPEMKNNNVCIIRLNLRWCSKGFFLKNKQTNKKLNSREQNNQQGTFRDLALMFSLETNALDCESSGLVDVHATRVTSISLSSSVFFTMQEICSWKKAVCFLSGDGSSLFGPSYFSTVVKVAARAAHFIYRQVCFLVKLHWLKAFSPSGLPLKTN